MGELIGSKREFVGGRVEPAITGLEFDLQASYPFVPSPAETQGEATAEGEISEASDEDETVSVDGEGEAVEVDDNPDDVVDDIAITAATSGKEFDGRVLAELMERQGPIEDVRLHLAIAVLRLGKRLTGDKMLDILEQHGFSVEVAAARLAKDMLAREGGVEVETVSPLPVSVDSLEVGE